MENRRSRPISNMASMRVSQGFWGTREHWQSIDGNKGTLVNFWEQGNKIRKITVRKHSERVWEHGNIGQFWKGTREQGPPLGDPRRWWERRVEQNPCCKRYYQELVWLFTSHRACVLFVYAIEKKSVSWRISCKFSREYNNNIK